MNTQAQVNDNQDTRTHYVIRICGALDERWAEWFSGVQIYTREVAPNTHITTLDCPAADQAQLRGILSKIWDLNLSLLSVHSADAPRTSSNSPDTAV